MRHLLTFILGGLGLSIIATYNIKLMWGVWLFGISIALQIDQLRNKIKS